METSYVRERCEIARCNNNSPAIIRSRDIAIKEIVIFLIIRALLNQFQFQIYLIVDLLCEKNRLKCISFVTFYVLKLFVLKVLFVFVCVRIYLFIHKFMYLYNLFNIHNQSKRRCEKISKFSLKKQCSTP